MYASTGNVGASYFTNAERIAAVDPNEPVSFKVIPDPEPEAKQPDDDKIKL